MLMMYRLCKYRMVLAANTVFMFDLNLFITFYLNNEV